MQGSAFSFLSIRRGKGQGAVRSASPAQPLELFLERRVLAREIVGGLASSSARCAAASRAPTSFATIE
jgi:hypothetical protein